MYLLKAKLAFCQRRYLPKLLIWSSALFAHGLSLGVVVSHRVSFLTCGGSFLCLTNQMAHCEKLVWRLKQASTNLLANEQQNLIVPVTFTDQVVSCRQHVNKIESNWIDHIENMDVVRLSVAGWSFVPTKLVSQLFIEHPLVHTRHPLRCLGFIRRQIKVPDLRVLTL